MSSMCLGSVVAGIGVYKYNYSHVSIKKILRENFLRNSLGALFSFFILRVDLKCFADISS